MIKNLVPLIVKRVTSVPARPQPHQRVCFAFLDPVSSVQTFGKRFLSSKMEKPIETAIRTALSENLNPIHLEVVNESYMHNVPKGSETHFKVLIVSDRFDSMPLIQRHRLVNDIVRKRLEGEFVHALSIEAKTQKQWSPSDKVEPSPRCLGGFGK